MKNRTTSNWSIRGADGLNPTNIFLWENHLSGSIWLTERLSNKIKNLAAGRRPENFGVWVAIFVRICGVTTRGALPEIAENQRKNVTLNTVTPPKPDLGRSRRARAPNINANTCALMPNPSFENYNWQCFERFGHHSAIHFLHRPVFLER